MKNRELIKVRLEPTEYQRAFLQYVADCVTMIYGIAVHRWEVDGRPKGVKWEKYRSELNTLRKEPEAGLGDLSKLPYVILAWVFSELRFREINGSLIEGGEIRDEFCVRWVGSSLVQDRIKIPKLDSWIKLADKPVQNGLITQGRFFKEGGEWFVVLSVATDKPIGRQRSIAAMRYAHGL